MKKKGIGIMGVMMLGVMFAISACKKTVENRKDEKAAPVTDTVTTRENNRIISYKVQSPTQEGIYAAVNDSDNTITVYLPYFYALNFLEVSAIGLPAGTTITPAADVLVPVVPGTPFTYTVTAADKSTRRYTVKVVVLEEKLVINEHSTATTTKTYTFNFGAGTLADAWIPVSGAYMVPSADYTTLHLMDAASGGQEVFKATYNTADFPLSTYMYYYYRYDKNDASTWRVKANTDYWLEVRSYNRVHRMKYPVRFSGI